MLISRLQRGFVGFALVLGACQSPPMDESATAADAVRAADVAWAAAATAHDLDAFVAAVEPTGSILAPNAPIATGAEAIRADFLKFFAMPALTLHWQPSAVVAAKSGELAYSTGTYQMTFTGPDGKPAADQGKYATVWRKQANGTWLVVLDVFNSDLPLPGT